MSYIRCNINWLLYCIVLYCIRDGASGTRILNLEYVCSALFTSVKDTGHIWELELIQIRSLKIIFPELSYKEAVILSELCNLEVILTKLCSNFFNNMNNKSHRLNYFLPETDNRRQLRHTRKYEPPKCRTDQFKHSFVRYLPFNFQ